ncbi:hypothetical protein KGY71_00510 [Candidatus Bipolaricaulota bacterium]|nr:hypothetical protein [Candidatus Bipolaricaulota bacterium]
MQKTKFALVSLLSLLVVFAPVSSALAESIGMSKLKKPGEKLIDNQKKIEVSGSTFKDIEKLGGEEISDERLDKEEGELGTLLTATAVAAMEISDGITGAMSSMASYETSTRLNGDQPTNAGRMAAGVSGFVSGMMPGPNGLGTGSMTGTVSAGVEQGYERYSDEPIRTFQRDVDNHVGSRFDRNASLHSHELNEDGGLLENTFQTLNPFD